MAYYFFTLLLGYATLNWIGKRTILRAVLPVFKCASPFACFVCLEAARPGVFTYKQRILIVDQDHSSPSNLPIVISNMFVIE